MATLERVMQMRQQGVSEPQIAQALRQEGVSPREINEALSQSQIKSALNYEPRRTSNTNPEFGDMTPSQYEGEGLQTPEPTQMQPSRTYEENQAQEETGPYPQPYPQEPQANEGTMMPMAQPGGDYAMQSPLPSPYANYYPEYQPQQATDIGTINDIAEQIVEEKIAPLKKQIATFTRFKEDLSIEMEKINERLTKVENTFNELQMAIIRKIGDYGEDIHTIAKELHTTQDSFSKLINPLTDNIREMQKITNSSIQKPERPRPQVKQEKSEKDVGGYSK